MLKRLSLSILGVCALLSIHSVAGAQTFVAHDPANGVFGEPGDVTQRENLVVREGESPTIYFRVGYQFQYSSVALYYTTDGSEPSGTIGFGTGTTKVLRSFTNQVFFLRNQSTGSGTEDWWRAPVPAVDHVKGTTIKYFIEAWGATTSKKSSVYTYDVKGPWPGQGSNFVNHTVGYPPYHMWKEEAVAGNNYLNVMLDRNGSIYDIYFPGAGTVQGIAAKNEGYVDGLDTFPAGLPLGSRGQLHLNSAFGGLRVDGKTYWLSNQAGTDYVDWNHEYADDTNTVVTTSRLTAGGNNLSVEQRAFAPKNIAFPLDNGANPNRYIFFNRVKVTNNGASSKTFDAVYYMDPALNGGDGYDGMFADKTRGAMVAYDNTFRLTSGSGEYNPSTFSDYAKSKSVYLAASMKLNSSADTAGGSFADDSWADTSTDQGQGWISGRITLAPGQTKEFTIALVGGVDNFAGATGPYNFQIAPVLDWFQSQNVSALENTTNAYWQNWLAQGTTVDFPDNTYDELFKRGLLATALHQDGQSGALIAGMHNGAYMYCWPRDAVWAAVTLDRAGHSPEARNIYTYLKDVAFRNNESWGGKGFFYQKYTSDGYIIWGAPQVDETAVLPWGVKYHFDTTGDTTWMSNVYDRLVYDTARASSEDSTLDSRLYYNEAVKLVYSMNLWEDSFDVFTYSNANIVRGLWDAASLADRLGKTGDKNLFNGRATDIFQGVKDRMAWNGENTDISQLGAVYPFRILPPNDPLMKTAVDRMNGVATDRFGNNKPIVNFTGEFEGMINRYSGDTYWGGGPWTLSTLWYGMYYLWRSDYTSGFADVDNHKFRIDKAKQFNTSVNLGAEQYSPSNSLLYPGQSDFRHQAAWPNAWESMSFYVDSMMGFLDFVPDAASNTLRISPKIPSTWNDMTFSNVRLGTHQFNIKVGKSTNRVYQTITNVTGNACNIGTWLKIPTGVVVERVGKNGVNVPFTYDATGHRVNVQTSLKTGAGQTTVIDVIYRSGPLKTLGDGSGPKRGKGE